MKKLLLLLFISSGIVNVFGQNVRIVDTVTNTVVNGQELTVVGNPSDNSIDKELKVTYTGFGTVTLQMKRIELNVTPGTKSTVCWSLCPVELTAGTKPVWDYGDNFSPVSINSGDTTDQFQCHFKPENIQGCSVFRYSLYDVNNVNDSVYVDIRYIHTNSGACDLGIEESHVEASVQLFPNPASNKINLKFGENTDITSVQIVDMLGKVIKTISIDQTSQLKEVDVSNINEGLYFYQALIGSKKVSSKKFVITR